LDGDPARAWPPGSTPRTGGDVMAELLDLYVNDGMVAMVDDRLVYMRGFGDAPNGADSSRPNLRVRPHVFLEDGRVVFHM